MTGSPLVRLMGFPATLLQGDLLVLDRWRWLTARLPRVSPGSVSLLDVGCGHGAFSIGHALRGYRTLGLSWDDAALKKAQERAAICKADLASFEVQDVRTLDAREDLAGRFDVVTCTEVIEHVLDDQKLMTDIARCLRPAGRLLLTTPNADYKPINRHHAGPFLPIEDGRHVRKGYTEPMLRALCDAAGLEVESVTYCSGFFSQKGTAALWALSPKRALYPAAWAVTLPLRPLPLLFDPILKSAWPDYSICIEARKPASGASSGLS